jgi:hypothetical protein
VVAAALGGHHVLATLIIAEARKLGTHHLVGERQSVRVVLARILEALEHGGHGAAHVVEGGGPRFIIHQRHARHGALGAVVLAASVVAVVAAGGAPVLVETALELALPVIAARERK